jgi:hypothetical protein
MFLRRYNVFDYIRDMMAAKRSACAAIFFVLARALGGAVGTASKRSRNRPETVMSKMLKRKFYHIS